MNRSLWYKKQVVDNYNVQISTDYGFKGITNQKMIFPHNQDNHGWKLKKYILALFTDYNGHFLLPGKPSVQSWHTKPIKLWWTIAGWYITIMLFVHRLTTRLKLFVVGFKILGKNLNSSLLNWDPVTWHFEIPLPSILWCFKWGNQNI